MEYALGIDGGGTKTCFLLADAEGNIVSHVNTSGIDFNYIGVEGVKNVIEGGVREILDQSGCKLPDITVVCAGIPCFGEYFEWDDICTKYFSTLFANAQIKCVNDVEVGMFGSLALGPGIHLVSGTGAIAFGRNDKGLTARSGGWSEHFSDEGSCYWLGMKLCELFTKQSDYRIAKGPLYHIVRQETNIAEDYEFIQYFKDNLFGNREKLAKMQFLLAKAANAGDASAIECYRKAAYELSLSVKAVYIQLQLSQQTRVSYSGGLFKSGKLIMEPLKDCLKDLNICLQAPTLTPAEGALLYAICIMEQIDIKTAIRHIQNTYK